MAKGIDVSNLQNCEKIKAMSALEAANALKLLASQIKGPVGLGIWDGQLLGKVSGQAYEGEMIAIFRDDDLIAPFGRRGDAESEACAALFATALANADQIAAAVGGVGLSARFQAIQQKQTITDLERTISFMKTAARNALVDLDDDETDAVRDALMGLCGEK